MPYISLVFFGQNAVLCGSLVSKRQKWAIWLSMQAITKWYDFDAPFGGGRAEHAPTKRWRAASRGVLIADAQVAGDFLAGFEAEPAGFASNEEGVHVARVEGELTRQFRR